MREFELIDHFFAEGTARRDDVILGIGDDAALLRVPPRQRVITAIATARNVSREESPESLGQRVLRLSLDRLWDLGATPAWATLALTMPEADEDWLARFSAGLKDLAKRFDVCLVGGDTTRGPLTITIVCNGFKVSEKQSEKQGF
uniref:AIR synthase related protein, N-terminal domain n=1 Tax=Candidatus Kentrum sp. UNK TaxID=2126344 RepID=A0A451B3B3_9GAMM|nr:MAG: AIR synthase related protein, N-terminal domain [Candidatus Kentron sp. UNK]VFK72765.1 MAG: AIR synthase related protein, N-terminal domain [Candidatus Kentron sp. UNK]